MNERHRAFYTRHDTRHTHQLSRRSEITRQALAVTSTPLETLVGITPALSWLEDDAGDRVGVKCMWCNISITGTEAQQKHNSEEHLTGAMHRSRSGYGGRSLIDYFGGRSHRGPAPAPQSVAR